MNKLAFRFTFFLVFVRCFHHSEQKASKVLKTGFQVFEKAIDIFSAGLGIADFLDKRESNSGLTEEDLDRLKNDILKKVEQMLAISESNIILFLNLQEEVARLKDINSVVKSSLADLDYYIKAEDETEKVKYKALFLKRFEEHDVVVEIRKLPALLSDTIPELSKPLKYLILDTTKCNMTSILEFEQFYANLISNAVALQFVYTETSNLNLDYVQDYWNIALNGTQNTFDEMENVCIDKFEESVSKEILEDLSAEDLHKNTKERYNWKYNDVFEYQPGTSYKFHYFISLSDEQKQFLFWNKGARSINRIVIFGDKNTTVPQWKRKHIQALLQAYTGLFQAAAKGPNAAKDLGRAIGTFINNINFIYKCIVVFYDDQSPNIKVLIDHPLSPAACVSIYASDQAGYYQACVYPEIWNDFASYLNAYTEIKGHKDAISAATAFVASEIVPVLLITVAFAFIQN